MATVPSPVPPSETLFPTQHEANQLATLLHSNKPSLMMSLQLFSEMLHIFDNDDVHNFLFADEPFQVSYLTNPNIRHISVACSSRETKIDPASPCETSMSDCYGSSYFLTPVFTSNNITFGVGVENAIYYPAPAWNFPETVFNAVGECRFVKNDNDGYMLIVACYETECIRVEFIKTLSSTSQVRCVIGTKLPLFRSATKGGSCNMDAVFPTLLMLQTSYENRDCPYCASQHSKCDCSFRAVTPRHPLDHSSFIANMASRLGTFYGVSHVSMYREEMGMCMGALGIRFNAQRSVDEDLIESLRTMAISRHALIQDPRSSVQNAGDVPPSDMQPVDNAFEDRDQVDPQQSQPIDQLWTDPALLPNDLDFDASDFFEIPNELNSVSNTVIVSHDAAQVQHISQTGPSLPVTDNSGTLPGSSEQSQENSCEAGNSSREQPLPNRSDSGTDQTGTQAVSSSNDKDVIRKLKAELRREKNRAAAQRSNMRKKALNDSLKHSLMTVREKVDLLRSKEMLLREENLRLRQLLEK